MNIFVLTHEYSDRSAFSVCGITSQPLVAEAWFKSSDETNVYDVVLDELPTHWMEGVEGRRERERKAQQKIASGVIAAMSLPPRSTDESKV